MAHICYQQLYPSSHEQRETTYKTNSLHGKYHYKQEDCTYQIKGELLLSKLVLHYIQHDAELNPLIIN
jgi:hypothetical protein